MIRDCDVRYMARVGCGATPYEYRSIHVRLPVCERAGLALGDRVEVEYCTRWRKLTLRKSAGGYRLFRPARRSAWLMLVGALKHLDLPQPPPGGFRLGPAEVAESVVSVTLPETAAPPAPVGLTSAPTEAS